MHDFTGKGNYIQTKTGLTEAVDLRKNDKCERLSLHKTSVN